MKRIFLTLLYDSVLAEGFVVTCTRVAKMCLE